MKKFTLLITAFFAITFPVIGQWTSQSSGLTNVDSNNLLSVYFTDANTGYAVGKAGTILKTTNGGTNWTALTSGITDELDAVCFTNANTGYAIGTVILKTTDGGTTWTNVYTSPYQYALRSVYFVNATTGYVVGMGMMGGTILKTIDGGTTWTKQTSGTNNQLCSVYFTDASTGYAVGAYGTILKTIDGGTTWTPQNSGTNYQLNAVYFSTSSTGYAVGANSIVLKTTDGGTTWSSQTGNTDYTLYSVCFPDANTGYISGSNNTGVGEILKTTNGGTDWTTNWTPLQSDTYYFSLNFPNVNTGYAVGIYGEILKYSNSTDNVVETEDWSEIMDNDSINYFHHIFEKNSYGIITATTKLWQHVIYGGLTIIDSIPRTGLVTFDGTNLSFSVQGTATETAHSTSSTYTLSIKGEGSDNGTAKGTYIMNFANTIWPNTLQGTWKGTKISGSGVTSIVNGLNTLTTDRQVILYPNPATDFIKVTGIEGTVLITVEDINGRTLLTKQVVANENISVGSLQNGIYIIKLTTPEGTTLRKIVKK